jgi:hypothetical protein
MMLQATLAAKRAKALQEAGQTSAAVQQALIARVSFHSVLVLQVLMFLT